MPLHGISSHARLSAQGDLAAYPSDSPKQQEAVWAVAATDAFQWGYDPVHYGVPEGSYATDPDGPARILEYRWALRKPTPHWWRLESGSLKKPGASTPQVFNATCDRHYAVSH